MTTKPLVLSPQEILTNLITTIKAGLIKAGVPNPQVDQNSDFYIISNALANQLGLIGQNLVIQADAQMADTATGADLDRLAAIYGLTRRAASPADGFITVTAPAGTTTNVPAGSQLTSTFGLIYQVVTGGSVQNNGILEVVSIDTGSAANLGINSVLTWQNAPGFLNTTATVSSAITGGKDAEDDTTFRTRLLNVLQNPPQYGNWSQIAQVAEAASPFIEKAYVYPTANGPSTQYVVFTQSQTQSNIQNRGIIFNSVAWLDGYAAVMGSAPAYVQTVIPYAYDGYAAAQISAPDGYCSVKNIPNDLAFSLDIPYPIGNSIRGTGGGWLNFAPFPNKVAQTIYTNGSTPTLATGYFAAVSSVTNSTHFSITAATSGGAADPGLINGVTKISWISDQTSLGKGWVVLTATINGTLSSVTNGVGTYAITITDIPFVNGDNSPLAVGDFIFPASVNGQKYLDTVLASFANLGPGQISQLLSLFPNSYRQPSANLTNTDVIDAAFLKALVDNNAEIDNANFYYNQSGITNSSTIQVSGSIYGAEPPIPSTIPSYGGTTNVGIWIPNQIGFYP